MNSGDLTERITWKIDRGVLKATGQEPDFQVDDSIGENGMVWAAVIPVGVSMLAQRENTGLRYDRVTTKPTFRVTMYGPLNIDFTNHQAYWEDRNILLQPVEEEYPPGGSRTGLTTILMRDITRGI